MRKKLTEYRAHDTVLLHLLRSTGAREFLDVKQNIVTRKNKVFKLLNALDKLF